jgi:hypothetical protein
MLPCRQLIVNEKIQLVLNFTLCLRDQTLTTLACNRDFMTRLPTGANGPRTWLPDKCHREEWDLWSTAPLLGAGGWIGIESWQHWGRQDFRPAS